MLNVKYIAGNGVTGQPDVWFLAAVLEYSRWSDMMSMDGERVEPWVMNGQPQLSRRREHEVIWPQRPPSLSTKHWQIWRTAIAKCMAGTTVQRNKIGAWQHEALEFWETFYNERESRVYISEGFWWRAYIKNSARTVRLSSLSFKKGELVANLPDSSHPCTVIKLRSGAIKVTGLGSIEDVQDPTEHQSVTDEVTEGWEVELADIPNNGRMVAQAIHEHMS